MRQAYHLRSQAYCQDVRMPHDVRRKHWERILLLSYGPLAGAQDGRVEAFVATAEHKPGKLLANGCQEPRHKRQVHEGIKVTFENIRGAGAVAGDPVQAGKHFKR